MCKPMSCNPPEWANHYTAVHKPAIMTYDGYENYETRTCALWLDTILIDNQMIQCDLADLRIRYQYNPNKDELILNGLAHQIERRLNDKADYIRRLWDTKDNNGDPDDANQQIIIDFINNSIERVNYREVAQQFIENIPED